jgi:flagellar assembly protein FliH
MASRIFHSTNTPAAVPHEWRRVGECADLSDGVLAKESPAVPEAGPDEAFQLHLKEQCELAFRQGEASGRRDALAELDEKMRSLSRAIENAASHKARLREQAEHDVVSLAMAIARRVIHREIQVDEEAILGLVKAAFQNANLREVTQVRVHPQFVSVLQNHLQGIGAPISIQLTGDASLELGGLILETARGSLDASAGTQLDEIGRGFADAMSLSRRRP